MILTFKLKITILIKKTNKQTNKQKQKLGGISSFSMWFPVFFDSIALKWCQLPSQAPFP